MPRPRKRLGQHFLTDSRILARIADAVEAGPTDTVVEIGPGPGGLTAELARRAGRVIGLEKDRALAAALAGRWANVSIVEGDALGADWHRLASVDPLAPSPVNGYRVTGNIPYNITSPLIDKALSPPLPAVIAFLVQREVADRVTAEPGSSDYGALSVGVQAVASVERLFRVSAGSFTPPPQVDSALLRMRPRADRLIPDSLAAAFRRLVVGLFGFRRKQLLRGVRELTGWPADRSAAALERSGLAPTVRPEVVSAPEFAVLLTVLVDAGWPGD
ncbi:MAG TPA: 16S rRNA (adenine(1518)-N(6)/adenine(1519)-N(6))-dimethyltransferase RsmA [Gemmatimonadales bacterium]|nr:16S rRNA (adenine(1518)-N(6)/adenine(1519)-N(6))-dimethyltransferase RsmA [Gemmatimonadales bacterium]